MLSAIKEFVFQYANCRNIFIPTVIIMLILFMLNLILAFRNFDTLKSINGILREEAGEEIIRQIEEIRLSKRFEMMWDDYYAAYSVENTVNLGAYLIKNDLFIDTRLFKHISRCVALIGVSAAATAAVMIPYLFDEERNPLICMFFILLAFEAFLEIFYNIIADIRAKRLAFLIEEFEMLSVRKLPGNGVDFASRPTMDKIDGLENTLGEIKGGIKQLNARMDRQFRLLDKENITDRQEEQKEDNQ